MSVEGIAEILGVPRICGPPDPENTEVFGYIMYVSVHESFFIFFYYSYFGCGLLLKD